VSSCYDDVRDAALNTELLSSENPSITAASHPMIQQLDPPRHDSLRDLLWRAFTPRRVAAMEPRIRELARGLLDALPEHGSGDLLRDYAAQLPSLVIGELIGIPPERRELFLEWTEAIILAQVPGREPPYNPFEKIYGEFAELLRQRSAAGRDDLMTALIHAELDGRRLTPEELLGFCTILVIGGNDTTANLIANGAVLLAKHPEQREELVRNPALIPSAVEEMLRYDSPTQALGRTATRDIELHGKSVHKGESVNRIWGSANHDERRFPDPERFDIRRADNRHVALGHGIHFCMGAHLARLEGRVAFEELLARMPRYELAREPVWQTSAWARAYHSVPVRF
jgi:hypothetical protein